MIAISQISKRGKRLFLIGSGLVTLGVCSFFGWVGGITRCGRPDSPATKAGEDAEMNLFITPHNTTYSNDFLSETYQKAFDMAKEKCINESPIIGAIVGCGIVSTVCLSLYAIRRCKQKRQNSEPSNAVGLGISKTSVSISRD